MSELRIGENRVASRGSHDKGNVCRVDEVGIVRYVDISPS